MIGDCPGRGNVGRLAVDAGDWGLGTPDSALGRGESGCATSLHAVTRNLGAQPLARPPGAPAQTGLFA
jgi:hypothetical protein